MISIRRYCLVWLILLQPISQSIALAGAGPTHDSQMVEDAWQAPAFIREAFLAVALHNEYEATEKPIRKWRTALNVWIQDHTMDAAQHRMLTETHLRHLSAITQHPINLANSPQHANVSVLFTSQDRWAQEVKSMLGKAASNHVNHAVCMASFKLDQQGAIQRAWVIIPADQAHMHRKLVSCIVEELSQIMGLPNDSEQVYPSIFNDKTPETLLTGLDALLLKLLYHPQVKIGMQRPQVIPVIDHIIADWQKSGAISRAEQEVRASELYEWLGY